MQNLFPKLPAPQDNTEFIIPFMPDGDYSLHELIGHVVRHYNMPVMITLTSFSITENAVRSFLKLKEDGLIINLDCVFDLSVKQHKLSLLFFGAHVVDNIYLTKNHSKLVLFTWLDKTIVIVGSANLNINNKIEAGIITNMPSIHSFYFNKLQNIIQNALKVQLHDFN